MGSLLVYFAGSLIGLTVDSAGFLTGLLVHPYFADPLCLAGVHSHLALWKQTGILKSSEYQSYIVV